MPFYFRKECPLNSGYLTSKSARSLATFRIADNTSSGIAGELVDVSEIIRKLLVDEPLFSRKFPA
ncbi:hypothetical protein F7F23_26640 [Escherichia coli]|nr:hypothetical protein F7F23_26640 [Escherichia coli]